MPEPEFSWVDIEMLAPNPWNPNVMSPDMFSKEIESIHEFGFVDPVTVREVAGLTGYQIIDGEQRWTTAKDHGSCVKAQRGDGWERHGGLRQLPIANLGFVDDEIAQQLTIVLNETRGTYDPKKMGALLTDLITIKPLAELVTVLPFTRDKIDELAELPKVDWQDVRFKAKVSAGERWVERVYRLPVDAADALDRAFRLCRECEGQMSDAKALQTIAEKYLESRP